MEATFEWLQKQRVIGIPATSRNSCGRETTLLHTVAIALYCRGAGTKAVAKRLGLTRASAVQVGRVLKSLGLFQRNRPSPAWLGLLPPIHRVHWGTHDIDAMARAEREYDRALFRHHEAHHFTPNRSDRRKIKRAHEKMKRTPELRIKFYMRKRLRKCVKSKGYSLRTNDLFGCTPAQLRTHLEKQFLPWMNWSNHGTAWHIDHIKPCASFDLMNPNEARICFHWSNLRPLHWLENIRKGNKT